CSLVDHDLSHLPTDLNKCNFIKEKCNKELLLDSGYHVE
ncbi:hypothetical protein A2U01_0072485, partial [Trifolium medium]|nr:hypothetical protein [Trifolium medium]